MLLGLCSSENVVGYSPSRTPLPCLPPALIGGLPSARNHPSHNAFFALLIAKKVFFTPCAHFYSGMKFSDSGRLASTFLPHFEDQESLFFPRSKDYIAVPFFFRVGPLPYFHLPAGGGRTPTLPNIPEWSPETGFSLTHLKSSQVLAFPRLFGEFLRTGDLLLV